MNLSKLLTPSGKNWKLNFKMIVLQRQKYRSMEQNRKPRDKSTNLWTPYLRQRRQGYIMEKGQPL